MMIYRYYNLGKLLKYLDHMIDVNNKSYTGFMFCACHKNNRIMNWFSLLTFLRI